MTAVIPRGAQHVIGTPAVLHGAALAAVFYPKERKNYAAVPSDAPHSRHTVFDAGLRSDRHKDKIRHTMVDREAVALSMRRTSRDRTPPRSVVTGVLLGDPGRGRSAQDRHEGIVVPPRDASLVKRMAALGISTAEITARTGFGPAAIKAITTRSAGSYTTREASSSGRHA